MGLLDDLARLAPPHVAKLIYTANLPEELPSFAALPFPVEVVRNPRPLGFGANHNQAFAHTTSKHFAVLNPDLRLNADPFPALLDRLQDTNIGVVAPLVLEADGSVADFARPLVSPTEVLRRRFAQKSANPMISQPDWLAGMFLVLRSTTFASLGGFDPRFTLYCEDADLCARIRLRGLKLAIAEEVSVTHLAQRASRRSLRPLLLHLASLLKFWRSPVYSQYRSLLERESASTARS